MHRVLRLRRQRRHGVRTAVIKDAVAHVQAGAGIVADSVPASEAAECRNKAAAVLRAVAIASTLRTVTP